MVSFLEFAIYGIIGYGTFLGIVSMAFRSPVTFGTDGSAVRVYVIIPGIICMFLLSTISPEMELYELVTVNVEDPIVTGTNTVVYDFDDAADFDGWGIDGYLYGGAEDRGNAYDTELSTDPDDGYIGMDYTENNDPSIILSSISKTFDVKGLKEIRATAQASISGTVAHDSYTGPSWAVMAITPGGVAYAQAGLIIHYPEGKQQPAGLSELPFDSSEELVLDMTGYQFDTVEIRLAIMGWIGDDDDDDTVSNMLRLDKLELYSEPVISGEPAVNKKSTTWTFVKDEDFDGWEGGALRSGSYSTYDAAIIKDATTGNLELTYTVPSDDSSRIELYKIFDVEGLKEIDVDVTSNIDPYSNQLGTDRWAVVALDPAGRQLAKAGTAWNGISLPGGEELPFATRENITLDMSGYEYERVKLAFWQIVDDLSNGGRVIDDAFLVHEVTIYEEPLVNNDTVTTNTVMLEDPVWGMIHSVLGIIMVFYLVATILTLLVKI